MSSMGQHNLRCDDELWRQAGEKARRDGRTLTEVITTGLRGYLGEAPPRFTEQPGVTITYPESSLSPADCAHRGLRPGAWCKSCESAVPEPRKGKS